MKIELIELHPGDEEKAWLLFQKSPMQAALHNLFVKSIFESRTKLETAKSEDVVGLQATIAAAKTFLGILHRNDPLPTI